jgi:hypothetical protein
VTIDHAFARLAAVALIISCGVPTPTVAEQASVTPSINTATVLRGRPPNHPYAEPEAVAHVATYRTQYEGDLRVTRNGNWLRMDRVRGEIQHTEISDLSAGVSFMFGHRRDEAVQGIDVRRSRADQDYHALERIDTGRSDSVLSEACRVIAWRRVNAHPYESPWMSCVTDDGIELWAGFESNGSIQENRRALSVERRRVPVRQIAPPPELLRWSTWRAQATAPTASVDGDYNMEMASSDGHAFTRIVRRHGAWTYTDTRQADGWRRFSLVNGALRVAYYEERPDGPAQITIYANAPGATEDTIGGPPRPLDDMAPELIVGERCEWFETFRTSHSSERACVTSDRLTLHYMYAGDGVRGGRPWSVRATQLSHEPLTERSIQPPPEVFAWFEHYAR